MPVKWAPIILTILLGLLFKLCLAQRVDSLKALLETSDIQKLCLVKFQIGYELVDTNPTEALHFAEESIKCFNQLKDTLQLVRGFQLKATAFRRINEIDSSNNTIKAILPLARKKNYRAELQDLLHGLALGLLYKAQFDEALKYNFEALEIRRSFGTQRQIGYTLSNIGLVYYKLADYRRALEYFIQALKQLRADPDGNKTIEKIMTNIALSYAYLGDIKQAEEYIREIYGQCGQHCSTEDLEHMAFCKGIISLARGDTTMAKKDFYESYTLAIADGQERLQLDNIIYLSRIYIGSNSLVEAEHYLRMAEKLILGGVPYTMELMNVYGQFAELYERKGDYKRVAEFQRRHMALKDSIYDDEVTTSLMRIEVAHIEREKNAKIETQLKLLRLKETIMSRQRMITILSSITVVLLIGFVIMLSRIIRDKKVRNEDLEARVRSRTIELERLVEQSKKWLDERRLWMQKILYSVNHTAKTIEGLSSLASIDPASNEKCIELIGREMRRLYFDVNGYASRSNSIGEDIKDTGSMF